MNVEQHIQVKYLREKQVRQKIPVARSTLWYWVKHNGFPHPKKLSPGVTVWLEHEVDEWLADQDREAE